MIFAKNKRPEKCQNRWCRNERSKARKVCETCKHREFVKKNPHIMVWHWIKKSAKRRNIFFNLDKLLFKEFLIKNNYVSLSGRGGKSLTVDRIKPELGYILENLQVITRSENTKKYHREEKTPF